MNKIEMIIEELPTDWKNHLEAIQNNLEKFEGRSYYKPSDYIGKKVLDFGGSGGQIAVALLLKGAISATLIDPEIPEKLIPILRKIPGLHVVRGYAETALARFENHFDFIVAHSVTEHIQNLPAVFDGLKLLLKFGGKFFIAHDNYYHASGHHDNRILQIGSDGKYGYQGPKCWESGFCSVSSDFRKNIVLSPPYVWFPYIWSQEDERRLKDGNCSNCNFKKRTNPWAHLLYQDEFTELFSESAFLTGRPNSTLNKITPFLLKQYLLEAGFDILLWERSFINNDTSSELLTILDYLPEVDLKTENVFVIATK